jgi:hypothetical protein
MKDHERSTTFDMSNPGGCSAQKRRTPFTPENNKLLIRTYEENRGVGSTCRTLSNVRRLLVSSTTCAEAKRRAELQEQAEGDVA